MLGLLGSEVCAQAQQVDGAQTLEEAQAAEAARTARAAVGEVGQRQRRQDVAEVIAPMGRLSNRVQNRVQNRIRNRIDRLYDPEANATSPYAVATEETRAAERRSRPR